MLHPQDPFAPSTSGCSWGTPILITGAISVGVAVFLKTLAHKSQSFKAELGESVFPLPVPEADPKAYQMALARSRQCMYVSKAVVHMKAGDPARAMVELGRALHENSTCRSAMLDGRYTKEELMDLYRLHLKNGPVPPSFATLLQLREMLSLSTAESEKVEEEVMSAGEAFSI